ncbi:MAG: hypothetical protein ABIQ95_15295, partial [Bdellovibrionia bacterium]
GGLGTGKGTTSVVEQLLRLPKILRPPQKNVILILEIIGFIPVQSSTRQKLSSYLIIFSSSFK